jgi:hypothetical protein
MNTRKIHVDLTREPGEKEGGWFDVEGWRNMDVPLVLVPGRNHGTIVSEPDELVDMVLEALAVEDVDGYRKWAEDYSTLAGGRLDEVEEDRWQQFVVRVVDERGDPVPDYYLELAEDGKVLEEFSLDVHAFLGDESFRCFHVNLSKLEPEERGSLELRLAARSGTDLVAYHGAGSEIFTRGGEPLPRGDDDPAWDARMDMTPLLTDDKVQFFFPYTTTLVEIRVNREPMPATGVNKVLRFAPVDGD